MACEISYQFSPFLQTLLVGVGQNFPKYNLSRLLVTVLHCACELNDPRAVTRAGPSIHCVCPAAYTKAIMRSSRIDRERGKGIGNGNIGRVHVAI